MSALNPTLFLTAQARNPQLARRRRGTATQRLYQRIAEGLPQELKGAFVGGQARLTIAEDDPLQEKILTIALPNDWIVRPLNRAKFAVFGQRLHRSTGITRVCLTFGADRWGALNIANSYWVVVSQPEVDWMVGAS